MRKPISSTHILCLNCFGIERCVNCIKCKRIGLKGWTKFKRARLYFNEVKYEQEKSWFTSKYEMYHALDVQQLLNDNQSIRDEFLRRADLKPPKTLRLIDCELTASLQEEVVGLVDWYEGLNYTAVSHTWGMEVYEVFDCECATKHLNVNGAAGNHSRFPPRCYNGRMCPQDPHKKQAHKQVIKDMLGMCQVLWHAAGAKYVWHDGICIAQHDEAEVRETIMHMGWIYSNASNTVIFLHYAGRPMAPIRHDGPDVESRWHTRVWTVQEGALSRRRRYCVRVGSRADLSDCQSLEEFQLQLAKWYNDATSEVVVIEEQEFLMFLVEFLAVLKGLMFESSAGPKLKVRTELLARKAWDWIQCIESLLDSVRRECIEFPTFAGALMACSRRSSKHAGDRMNSILALAGVQDFVAKKDFQNVGEMEAATIDFSKRQGTQGLATAVFSANVIWGENESRHGMQHSWVPDLTRQLISPECAMVGAYLKSTQGSINAYERVVEVLKQELEGAHFQVLPNGNLQMSRCYWGIVKLVCYCQYNFDLETPIPVTALEEEAAALQAIPMVLFAYDTIVVRAAYDINYQECCFGDVIFLSPPQNCTTLHVCLAFPARHRDNTSHQPPMPFAEGTRALLLPATAFYTAQEEESTPIPKLASFSMYPDLQQKLASCPAAIKYINTLTIQ